ncbi:hypothetical protein NLI96_g2947 [Meripilus lineatus]|uniref:DUF6699 domain-containing protein n=1 Tax=Meripilus lineatus TaxID=2056292 RepID=A0AAD5V7S9_9APHY|nr:hypothetical protein NLI96_g2947 [Physisporinus lineatus]
MPNPSHPRHVYKNLLEPRPALHLNSTSLLTTQSSLNILTVVLMPSSSPQTPYLPSVPLPSLGQSPPRAPHLPVVPLPPESTPGGSPRSSSRGSSRGSSRNSPKGSPQLVVQSLSPSQTELSHLLDSENYTGDRSPINWSLLQFPEEIPAQRDHLRQSATTPPTKEMSIYLPFGDIEIPVNPGSSRYVTIGDVLRSIREVHIQPVLAIGASLEDDEIRGARQSCTQRTHGQDTADALGILGDDPTLWDVLHAQNSVKFAGISNHQGRWMLHTRESNTD